jgi:hypothetical protein
VFEISTFTPHGRRVRHDLHNLPLRNGVLAHTLDSEELYRVLAKMKVPVRADMGQQALLLAYSKHLQATTPDPITGKLPAAERTAP